MCEVRLLASTSHGMREDGSRPTCSKTAPGAYFCFQNAAAGLPLIVFSVFIRFSIGAFFRAKPSWQFNSSSGSEFSGGFGAGKKSEKIGATLRLRPPLGGNTFLLPQRGHRAIQRLGNDTQHLGFLDRRLAIGFDTRGTGLQNPLLDRH